MSLQLRIYVFFLRILEIFNYLPPIRQFPGNEWTNLGLRIPTKQLAGLDYKWPEDLNSGLPRTKPSTG